MWVFLLRPVSYAHVIAHISQSLLQPLCYFSTFTFSRRKPRGFHCRWFWCRSSRCPPSALAVYRASVCTRSGREAARSPACSVQRVQHWPGGKYQKLAMPEGWISECVWVCAPPYPEWISLQGSHHSQKQWLLQQRKHSTDQRLHPGQTSKLWGGIPGDTGHRRAIFSFSVGSCIHVQKTR